MVVHLGHITAICIFLVIPSKRKCGFVFVCGQPLRMCMCHITEWIQSVSLSNVIAWFRPHFHAFRAVYNGCVCITSRTWHDFFCMPLIRQFCSERTWTLQKLTHPSPKVTCSLSWTHKGLSTLNASRHGMDLFR